MTRRKRKSTSFKFTSPSLTKQSFKDECDINNIVSRFAKTGVLDHEVLVKPKFGDFLGVSDYQSALNQVIEAEEAFDNLPAKVRSRFKNQPVEFLEFCADEKNYHEMVELGLIEPSQSVAPKGSGVAEPGAQIEADKPVEDPRSGRE